MNYAAPGGDLMLGAYGDGLCLCLWRDSVRAEALKARVAKYLDADFAEDNAPVLDLAVKELDEYFEGKRKTFEIPLLFCGTDFQMSVWEKLPEIPYGETITYSELAERIGKPKSVRAAANAVGANALDIVVPCHRITGAGNHLGGYNGGIEVKRILLALERENTSGKLIYA